MSTIQERDPFNWWRQTLAGKHPPIHEGEPQCGYFKVRDRRGLNADLAPIKRPFVAAAIWIVEGELRAEIAGEATAIDRAWPWIAKHPISFEDYAHWHAHERWPEQKDAAA